MKKIIAFLAAILFVPMPKMAAYSTTLKTVNVSIEDVFEREQTKQITLDGFSSLVSILATDGAGNTLLPSNYTCEFSGNILSITLDNAVSHGEKINPKKYLKNVQTEKQSSAADAFPEALDYTSADGYNGTLNKLNDIYVKSGEYIAEDTKTVEATKTNASNSFADTIAYNAGGYKGTLTKSGSAVYRTDLTGSKTVTVNMGRQFVVGREIIRVGTRYSSYYDRYYYHEIRANTSLERGFGGFISEMIRSASLCSLCAASGSGISTLSGGAPNTYGLKIDYAMNSIPSTYSYSGSDGYSGTLRLAALPKSCWGSVKYSVAQNAHYGADKYSGHPNLYYDGISPAPDANLSSFINGSKVAYTTKNISTVNSEIAFKSSALNAADEYSSSFTNQVLLFEDDVIYSGDASKKLDPAYVQTYRGEATRPESDTRVYGQMYQGTAYKGENAPVYSYHIEIQYISADFSAPAVSEVAVTNKSEIQSEVFGADSGITIELGVQPAVSGRYFSAQASYNGIHFPAVWSDGGGVIQADDFFQGSIEIPNTAFTASAKNALVTVTVSEFPDAGMTDRINEITEIVRVNIDVTPPVISHFVNKRLGTVTLTAADALSGVDTLKYRINGGVWSNYEGAITVSENCAIEAEATDKCGNAASERFEIKLSGGLDETDVNVYVTENLSRVCYIINSNQSNTGELPLSELKIE